jgi:hypothetical protein
MASRTPTLQELLNLLGDRLMANLRCALPAAVDKYDSDKQLADVKPLIRDAFEDEDGAISNESLPVIPHVPVMFPGGAGLRLTFPLNPGDTGLLVFSDRSLDTWQDQGGEVSPTDLRRHHLSDAVFFPGLHPNNKPWSGAEAGVVTLGSDTGAADFVALAAKVTAQLNALKSAIAAASASFLDGGAALNAQLVTFPGSVASATVKVKG